MHHLRIAAAIPLLFVACPATETPVTTGEEETGAGESSGGGETPTSTSGEPTTGDPGSTGTPGESSGESTGPAPPPVCGNGFPEGDEPCDDANDDPDDGCNKDCERTGVPIWTVSWDSGAKNDDLGTAVVIADGNIFVAGSVEKADNYSDGMVRKLDAQGEELAKFEYAGQLGLDDYGRGLAVGADGSVFLTGFESLGEDAPDQGYVRKWTADGEVVWTYLQPSMFVDGDSAIYAIAVAGDAIYVAGSEETADKVYETYVHRLDPADGQPTWTAHLEAVGFNTHGLAIDPGSGDVLLATIGIGANDTPVPMVVRLDPGTGDVQWMKPFSGLGSARGVAVNAAGDIAAIGNIIGEFDDYDIWTARLTATGEVVWANKYDHVHKDDVGFGIAWNDAGDLYTAGYVISATDLNDAFVRRLTGDGETYWTSLYSGGVGLYDSLAGVAVGADKVVVVGNEGVLGHGANQWIRAYEP